MWLIDEMQKALEGKPSEVTLGDISDEELEKEGKLRARGYEFAFGRGWASRDELIESLTPRT